MTGFARGTLAYGTAIVVEKDGQILVAGYSGPNSSAFDFALVRYTEEWHAGCRLRPRREGPNRLRYASIRLGAGGAQYQADGKIIVAGYSAAKSRIDFALARYRADGKLDTTFGSGGKVLVDLGSSQSGLGSSVRSAA